MPPQGQCGKKNYMSPETIAQAEPFFGHLGDMWSVGVILFILLTGYPPMECAMATDPRFVMIRDGMLGQMLVDWGVKLDPAAVDLLQRMLKLSPFDRMSIDDILAHPWMLAS